MSLRVCRLHVQRKSIHLHRALAQHAQRRDPVGGPQSSARARDVGQLKMRVLQASRHARTQTVELVRHRSLSLLLLDWSGSHTDASMGGGGGGGGAQTSRRRRRRTARRCRCSGESRTTRRLAKGTVDRFEPPHSDSECCRRLVRSLANRKRHAQPACSFDESSAEAVSPHAGGSDSSNHMKQAHTQLTRPLDMVFDTSGNPSPTCPVSRTRSF